MNEKQNCDICKKKIKDIKKIESPQFLINTCPKCMEKIEEYIINLGEEEK